MMFSDFVVKDITAEDGDVSRKLPFFLISVFLEVFWMGR